MQSCLKPGLPPHLVQELNVGTVALGMKGLTHSQMEVKVSNTCPFSSSALHSEAFPRQKGNNRKWTGAK